MYTREQQQQSQRLDRRYINKNTIMKEKKEIILSQANAFFNVGCSSDGRLMLRKLEATNGRKFASVVLPVAMLTGIWCHSPISISTASAAAAAATEDSMVSSG